MSDSLSEATMKPAPSLLDAHERTLHLLPVLQADPFDRLQGEDISLTVSGSWTGGSLVPEGGVIVRQAYPNPLYYVGGSDLCRLGWFVSLPDHVAQGQLTFRWEVEAKHIPPGRFVVDHVHDMTFEPGQGRTYSMDVACWWEKSGFATEGHEKPEIGRNRFSRLKAAGISPTRRACVSGQTREGSYHLEIHEAVSLPAVRLSDLWTVQTYGGDHTHSLLERLQ